MMLQPVREITGKDRDQWELLWAAYNAFYGRDGASALSGTVVETTWGRLMNADEPVFGFVFENEARLLGLAHCVFHRNLIHVANTCYMQDLFTAPEARGKGVGRALLAGIRVFCKSRGVDNIYWHTQTHNATARKLYDDVGQNTEFLVYRWAI